jgi:hypothetical protein
MLWIITGGTPALSLEHYDSSMRYDKLEMWDDAHWNGRHYVHQDPNALVGPMPETVLPDGLKTVDAYLAHVLPRVEKRDRARALLPQVHQIKSQRKHDREDRTYVWATISIRTFVQPVVFESKYYGGRCTEKIVLFEPEWQRVQELTDAVVDRQTGVIEWWTLDDDTFMTLYDALWALYNMENGRK